MWSEVGTDNNFNNYGQDPTKIPGLLPRFNFVHTMPGGNTAFVQEWMRVVQTSKPIAFANKTSGNDGTLWVQWNESLTEKQKAIKDLFDLAIATRDKKLTDIYINVLSGYLVDPSKYSQDGYKPGFLPQKDPMDGFTKSTSSIVTDHGKGGDFAGLAKELNKYTYDLLSSGISEQGPWGLVMMDHIKANDVSADLVELIMMNNFKFPLVTGDAPDPEPEPEPTTYNATYSNGGEAISFK